MTNYANYSNSDIYELHRKAVVDKIAKKLHKQFCDCMLWSELDEQVNLEFRENITSDCVDGIKAKTGWRKLANEIIAIVEEG